VKQPLLTTKIKVEEYLQVAIGYSTAEFDRFIREAQEFDLKPLLGDEFYFDLLKNQLIDPYDKIIAGTEYTHNENTYYHEGLNAVLSYFTYARFILKSNAVSTSHGIVTKKTPNSEPISQSEKKDLYYSHRQDANTLFESVVKYMNRNNINYNNRSVCTNTASQDIVVRATGW
jgi:hypothetical protein